MKRLGLIVRADRGGLAAQTMEVHRHLQPEETLLIDLGAGGRGPTDHASFPGAFVAHGVEEALSDDLLDAFLSRVDTVFSVETFYRRDFCARARDHDVETIVHANPELIACLDDGPDQVWLPTSWEAQRLPRAVGATVTPMPVATDRLPFSQRSSVRTWLHVAAPAFHDRNGTALVQAAISHIRHRCTLLVRGSDAIAPTAFVDVVHLPETRDYWDYPVADALVLPRRYGGLSLVMQEAMALGMPVVSLDLPPYRDAIHPRLRVPAFAKREVSMKAGRFSVHACIPELLAAAMNEAMDDDALVAEASEMSGAWAAEHAWDRRLGWWQEALRGSL